MAIERALDLRNKQLVDEREYERNDKYLHTFGLDSRKRKKPVEGRRLD